MPRTSDTDNLDELARLFERERGRLRHVAHQMLGSETEADDVVQEAWMRLSRGGTEIDNLGGWLTTVVSRICLDALRSRSARGEHVPLEDAAGAAEAAGPDDPGRDAALADAVGSALFVVLEALGPAERVAFVLHDVFDVPHAEVGRIVGRTEAAARQLASRARRRVRGRTASRARERGLADAFLAALQSGDLAAVLAVLDPDLVVRADAGPDGAPHEVRGARAWAEGAVAFAGSLAHARVAWVDGAPGLVWAPGGRVARAVRIGVTGGRVARLDVVTDPEVLGRLRIEDAGEPKAPSPLP